MMIFMRRIAGWLEGP